MPADSIAPSMSEAIDAATPFQRFVLLAVLELDHDGQTPVYSFDVRDRCAARLDDLAADRFGGVTREDVIKALSALEAEGVVSEADRDDESPVGKGRPAYALAVDAETALDALDDDDALAPVVERLRA